MTATILITGATGFIGFRILTFALEAGHAVRFTARSEAKSQVVLSNPAVQKLAPGNRLVPIIVPDLQADDAFELALDGGVTHVIHTGAPVPAPGMDPKSDIFEPTVQIVASLLNSALKKPAIRRIVITSSIVANLGLVPSGPATASTRVSLPNPLPAFGAPFEGYVFGKAIALQNADKFVKTHSPHFTVSHVVPGYVFGRNELALDATMMQTQNSSNNFLMMAMMGVDVPIPIHGGYAHIEDLAEAHLVVAMLDPDTYGGPLDFGVAPKVDYSSLFDYVEKAFPDAVATGVFKKGTMPTLPVDFDSTGIEKLLGRKLKSFETAVMDVAAQYLEILG